jgi:hypothetical protein
MSFLLSENQTSVREVPSRLKWCVGKFVYARGASKPMHFMELKNFIVDDATDYSHLFYLRGLRGRQLGHDHIDDELRRWMNGTAAKPLAETVLHVLDSIDAREVSIVEYFPGVGLTFEYLKLLLRLRSGSDNRKTEIVHMEGRGPAHLRNQFLVLQADEYCDVTYREEDTPEMNPASAVVVFNQNQTVRYEELPKYDVDGFLRQGVERSVVAMRVTRGRATEQRTTVKCRAVDLPGLQGVLNKFRQAGSNWYFRFIEGFDSGFFIPEQKGPTGLLLAYNVGRAWPLEGFEPIS